ncbi:hypothetical protein [Leisingera sp. S232]|uniref:hypothetical protein n=1 Tax=Leisingera sp. S232 TaxID=3415132 RepID=UPI003C7B999B
MVFADRPNACRRVHDGLKLELSVDALSRQTIERRKSTVKKDVFSGDAHGLHNFKDTHTAKSRAGWSRDIFWQG